MAVIVKGEITITKGFDHWKSMVFSQKEKMAGMGMQFLFAGTEKNDPTKLHTIIKFESVEAIQAFGADKELTETRRQAGAVIESGVMTPISDQFFTNYPDTFIQHQIEGGRKVIPVAMQRNENNQTEIQTKSTIIQGGWHLFSH